MTAQFAALKINHRTSPLGVCSSGGATFAAEMSSTWFETGYIGEPFKHAQWLTLGKTHTLGRSTDFRLEIGFVPCEKEYAYIDTANAMVGIIFGASDEGNYYLLKIYTQIGESWLMAAIFECRDGVTSQLAEKDITRWLAPAAFIGSEHTAVLTAGALLRSCWTGIRSFQRRSISAQAGSDAHSPIRPVRHDPDRRLFRERLHHQIQGCGFPAGFRARAGVPA